MNCTTITSRSVSATRSRIEPRQSTLFDPSFVRKLFDEMAHTYGFVNLVSSFGFAWWWRRQCVRQIELAKGASVIDLMTGMGELLPDVARHIGPAGNVVAIDISPAMCAKAQQRCAKGLACSSSVVEVNALESGIPDGSADAIVCSFGLKTLSRDQIAALAKEVARILKPGGTFSFVEISVPPSWLRVPYMLYLRYVVPAIGWLFLGNPENYHMLGVYTEAFGDCEQTAEAFRTAGLVAENRSFFFGCATGVRGNKPLKQD